MSSESIFFALFIIFILLMLFLDLGLFRKKGYHKISIKESLTWTCVWVGLSLLFFLFTRFFGHLLHGIDDITSLQNVVALHHNHLDITGLTYQEALTKYNHNLSLQYITGYIIEYSLSMDNVFVILMIFISFNVPEKYYKKVLMWGIIGAIIMRFLFIFMLSAVIHKAEWVLYFFGALLLYTAFVMAKEFFRKTEKKIDVEHHVMVRFARKFFPVHPQFEAHKFWIKKKRIIYITPLFLVLMVVEFSDVIFAVDSVPAIFAVTRDPYIVFFSNVFAIMGLRSLFFLLSHFFNKFYYLKLGLAILLGFIGVKMLLPVINQAWKLPTELSLLLILGILATSIVASLVKSRKEVGS